jgi:hypothetical protein
MLTIMAIDLCCRGVKHHKSCCQHDCFGRHGVECWR